ncbi:MAG: hypothetical protein BJ554DRAFT_4502, partial [Olpidium bornovanus]
MLAAATRERLSRSAPPLRHIVPSGTAEGTSGAVAAIRGCALLPLTEDASFVAVYGGVPLALSLFSLFFQSEPHLAERLRTRVRGAAVFARNRRARKLLPGAERKQERVVAPSRRLVGLAMPLRAPTPATAARCCAAAVSRTKAAQTHEEEGTIVRLRRPRQVRPPTRVSTSREKTVDGGSRVRRQVALLSNTSTCCFLGNIFGCPQNWRSLTSVGECLLRRSGSPDDKHPKTAEKKSTKTSVKFPISFIWKTPECIDAKQPEGGRRRFPEGYWRSTIVGGGSALTRARDAQPVGLCGTGLERAQLEEIQFWGVALRFTCFDWVPSLLVLADEARLDPILDEHERRFADEHLVLVGQAADARRGVHRVADDGVLEPLGGADETRDEH